MIFQIIYFSKVDSILALCTSPSPYVLLPAYLVVRHLVSKSSSNKPHQKPSLRNSLEVVLKTRSVDSVIRL